MAELADTAKIIRDRFLSSSLATTSIGNQDSIAIPWWNHSSYWLWKRDTNSDISVKRKEKIEHLCSSSDFINCWNEAYYFICTSCTSIIDHKRIESTVWWSSRCFLNYFTINFLLFNYYKVFTVLFYCKVCLTKTERNVKLDRWQKYMWIRSV